MKLIVVGAGLSGLVSALGLQEGGHEVTVLEARDRVGGRVLSLREGFRDGQYADIGAEIIYQGQDRIVELVERFGLTLTPHMSLGTHLPDLLMDGRRLDRAETAEVVSELRETYRERPPEPYESVAAWGRRARVGRWTYALMEAMVQSTPVAPLRLADASEFNPHLGWGHGYRKIGGGNDQLPRRISASLDVRLGDPVRVVGWSAAGVTVETDRESHRADRVLVCVPGPLTTEIGFDPPLPEEKVRALLALRYGTGARLAVQYAEKDVVRGSMQAGAFTDRMPGWFLDQSIHQPGDAIVVSSVLGGDHEPPFDDPETVLREADRTMELLAGQPVTRTFGAVVSWTRDPWARCVVRAPMGDQRETVLPLVRAPLESRVFFAGEHTDDRVGPGGMEGAIRSAYRAVDELLQVR
jgi:monoamine oxidase